MMQPMITVIDSLYPCSSNGCWHVAPKSTGCPSWIKKITEPDAQAFCLTNNLEICTGCNGITDIDSNATCQGKLYIVTFSNRSDVDQVLETYQNEVPQCSGDVPYTIILLKFEILTPAPIVTESSASFSSNEWIIPVLLLMAASV